MRRLLRRGRVGQITQAGENSTTQTTLRWTILMLLFLLVIANQFGLDVVRGAFLAGGVLRRWAPGDTERLDGKLDAIGYGFFFDVEGDGVGVGVPLPDVLGEPLTDGLGDTFDGSALHSTVGLGR